MSNPTPTIDRMLGGALGRHARPGGVWFRPAPWAYFLLTLNYLVLMIRQVPCMAGANNMWPSMCYSDISVLYYWRGLKDGQIPYLDTQVEYPVLTGYFMELGRRIVVLLGGRSEPGLPASDVITATAIFFGATALMIFALLILLVRTHLKFHRPWDAMMIAVSPAILTTGLINWDALVIALTALALLSWAKGKPIWTGVWLGLGIAAKLYPLLLLVPLVVLGARTGKYRQVTQTVVATVVSWVLANLPVYLATPDGWWQFWKFNAERGGDLGSIWYVLKLAGWEVADVSVVEAVVMVIGTSLLCGLLLLSRRRARLAQGVFLIVALFLMVNKVYSPQYVLWLLPLLVLARPKWLEWGVFTVAETAYWVAIWAHLGGALPAGTPQERLYWVAVLLRIGVTIWLSARVVRDMVAPEHDPIRADGSDDPDGGVFDKAPDAPWATALRGAFARR